MDSTAVVEAADRVSRKRVIVGAAAALAFLAIQLVAPAFFSADLDSGSRTRLVAWTVNVVVLLAVLATGGGLLNRRPIRALVNDDLSKAHQRSATILGFWVAMATALALFLIDPIRPFSAREAIYLVVSSSVFVAVAAFSYLEHRAHFDA